MAVGGAYCPISSPDPLRACFFPSFTFPTLEIRVNFYFKSGENNDKPSSQSNQGIPKHDMIAEPHFDEERA